MDAQTHSALTVVYISCCSQIISLILLPCRQARLLYRQRVQHHRLTSQHTSLLHHLRLVRPIVRQLRQRLPPVVQLQHLRLIDPHLLRALFQYLLLFLQAHQRDCLLLRQPQPLLSTRLFHPHQTRQLHQQRHLLLALPLYRQRRQRRCPLQTHQLHQQRRLLLSLPLHR
jgi:hypothetical protein